MKKSSQKAFLFATYLMAVLFFAETAFAASDEKIEHDYSRLAVFVQPAISFINFEEREYFQHAIDTIYYDFRAAATTEAETLSVAKQDFQKVNFCFPITAGLQYQVIEDHFISAGIGFIYDNESIVLTDRKGSTHNYSYTLQGVPLFLEYRFAFPKNLITLGSGNLFSVALRWYWTLPGTEIYTSWGMLEAKNSALGAGFGISLGYLFASWKNINLYGDIGFTSISVKSKDKFSKIVPGGPDEKAKWNLGGLQFQIRGSFGIWNNPRKKTDDDDDDDKPESDTTKVAADSLVADSLTTDSLAAKVATDSLAKAADSTAKDSSAAKAATDSTVADTAATATQAAPKAETKSAPAAKPAAAKPADSDAAKTATEKPAEPAAKPAADSTAAAPKKAPANNAADSAATAKAAALQAAVKAASDTTAKIKRDSTAAKSTKAD